jgi:hypothetical protein
VQGTSCVLFDVGEIISSVIGAELIYVIVVGRSGSD